MHAAPWSPKPADAKELPAFARPYFDEAEYEGRMFAVRRAMERDGLDGLLVASPENIYYLVGLSHQGYFAVTVLLLLPQGPSLLVTRSMELVTVATQAPDCEHVGFSDHERPVDGVARALRAAGLDRARLGVEKDTMYLPVNVWEGVRETFPAADWVDASGIVDELRMVKSPQELVYVRQAAAMSDRAVRAGIEEVGVGVNEREIAAEVYRSLVLGGSEYPGFVPLVRSLEILLHEHETWRDRVLMPGDGVFMELSGCVRRYHAPLTRMVHVGHEPPGLAAAAETALNGLDAILGALRPGALSGEVYAAWQAAIDAGLGHGEYRRHHCGYGVGIGFPPSWVGGSSVMGIRPGSETEVREGMVFHVLSWLLGQEPGDYGVSDTAVVTAEGAELLTSTKRTPTVVA
ncbi:MAG: M24 family metallopeptidase [Nitriliruptorales bacterium]